MKAPLLRLFAIGAGALLLMSAYTRIPTANVMETAAKTGAYVEPHPELTYAKLVTPLVAQVSAVCAGP